MSVGYQPGSGPLRQSHPFTPLTLAVTAAVLAFALPAPAGPLALGGAAVLLALVERVAADVTRAAVLTALPFWVFLFLLHVVIGDAPQVALITGARIFAVVAVFLLALATVHPGRLLDGLVDRGVPFAAAYLLTATLQVVPRLRARAGQILDAQRCRGLRVRGGPHHRIRAVVPLAIPLVLSVLAEVDDRTIALESRGMGASKRRTPLDPPADSRLQRAVRWGLLGVAIGAILVRAAG